MSELLSNQPLFTIVMGCNGAGKSAWKRKHYDELPGHYLDQDSLAGGLGDWNDQDNRDYTRKIADREIESYIEQRFNFGIESTFSGRPGPDLMDRVIKEGYRVRGVYIGTNEPEINISRIAHRVRTGTGHRIDPIHIPDRYRYSLSNLRKKIQLFDELELIDNSEETPDHQANPILQCVLEKGEITLTREKMAPWCSKLLERIAEIETQRESQLERQRKKNARAESRGLGH